jgi:hypothetical protein
MTEAYHDLVQQIVRSSLTKYSQDVDRMCWRALQAGCGVRVDHYDGGYTIAVDPQVPALEIHQYGP